LKQQKTAFIFDCEQNFSFYQACMKRFFTLSINFILLTVSIKDFPGLSKRKETIHPPFNPQNKILRRATSQPLNLEQDFCKNLLADSHLSHLKGNVLAVPDNLRTDLDQFRKQSTQRPMSDFPW